MISRVTGEKVSEQVNYDMIGARISRRARSGTDRKAVAD